VPAPGPASGPCGPGPAGPGDDTGHAARRHKIQGSCGGGGDVPVNGAPSPGGPGPSAPPEASPPPLAPPALPEQPPVLAPSAPAPPPVEQVAPAERLPFGAPALELPRTGHDSRPLAAAGGVNLFLAGLALITGARRRRHRQAA